jgi:NDP-sugar pyrophosphorylase family protein
VSIHYSHEDQLLGTAGALLRVADHLSDTFVLVYGDNIHALDLMRAIQHHRRKGAMATVTVFERPDVWSSGILAIEDDDRITRILEKPKTEAEVFSHWVNAGLMILDRDVLRFIPSSGASDMCRDVVPALLEAGEPVYGFRMAEGPIWVDTPYDLERAKVRILEKKRNFSPPRRLAASGSVAARKS